MNRRAKLAALAILIGSFATARMAGQQPQTQNPPPSDQTQEKENPPHVDQEPDPASRSLEKTIMDAIQQDPHMAYSRVRVHVTDTEVDLSGVVLTATAKDQAAQIASQHAEGRTISNRIKVNKNTHE